MFDHEDFSSTNSSSRSRFYPEHFSSSSNILSCSSSSPFPEDVPEEKENEEEVGEKADRFVFDGENFGDLEVFAEVEDEEGANEDDQQEDMPPPTKKHCRKEEFVRIPKSFPTFAEAKQHLANLRFKYRFFFLFTLLSQICSSTLHFYFTYFQRR
jgi:hypothetical protein